jgi:hypothetical protein
MEARENEETIDDLVPLDDIVRAMSTSGLASTH